MNSKPRLRGVQLYTLRAEMDRDLAGTLEAVAAAGYRQVEFAGFFGREPAEIRTLLEAQGLTAPASHFPLEQMEADFASVIAQAKALGSQYVVLAWLEQGRRSAADYRKLVQNLNHWGRLCRDAGLRLAYHNHDFEFVETDGFIPYQLLLDGSDPGLVSFEMDIYWMHKAGQDPLDYFARYPGRFPLWHLKDATAAGTMADVGLGIIDFPALLAQAEKAGLEYAFVERDDAAAPLQSIRHSFETVTSW
ncbi:sugar phosphate isomerase/epimerase [uncultured Microbulbifer sp.]|uniref:sugar phosphate isomerase/epimerase family protein n=1 Tax=uncultured Microbulbifer sp. TaxID=348147 RepID=UPI0025F49F20|nr:sugar phosphate isomerase/epimerase [uncultured Microbulbifer sp.]